MLNQVKSSLHLQFDCAVFNLCATYYFLLSSDDMNEGGIVIVQIFKVEILTEINYISLIERKKHENRKCLCVSNKYLPLFFFLLILKFEVLCMQKYFKMVFFLKIYFFLISYIINTF